MTVDFRLPVEAPALAGYQAIALILLPSHLRSLNDSAIFCTSRFDTLSLCRG